MKITGPGLVILLIALFQCGCLGQELSLRDISKRYDDSRTDTRMTGDRDVGRDAYELIESKGYDAERHTVTTEDGYILQMIRIVGSPNEREGVSKCPKGAKKSPVLLQHGLIDSAATWVMNMPEQSLGFVLADLGYDVWLGNNRGTSYSLKHTRYKEGLDGWDKEFWDFSWDDMARYDLPAEINYILQATGSEDLAYVGHSQGTTQAFAAFSLPEFADLAKKVRIHIALAPVAFVGNTESVLFQLAGNLDIVRNLAVIPEINVFGNTFLGTGAGSDLIQSFIPSLCSMFLGDCDTVESTGAAHESFFNTGMMGSLFGLPDMMHLNQSRIPVYLAHIPEGTSVKNLIHWSQAVKSKAFRRYDYGSCPSSETCANTFKYGQGTAPDYDLSNYEVPTVLVSGRKDPIANRKDVQKLVRSLARGQEGVLLRSKELESYDHNDFTIAIDGGNVLFPFILDYLEEYACSTSRGSGLEGIGQEASASGLVQEDSASASPHFSWNAIVDALSSLTSDFSWDDFTTVAEEEVMDRKESEVFANSVSDIQEEEEGGSHSLLSFLSENVSKTG